MTLFQTCRTQWHRVGLEGIAVGLDYTALDFVMKQRGLEKEPGLFDQLQVLEQATLDYWSEQR